MIELALQGFIASDASPIGRRFKDRSDSLGKVIDVLAPLELNVKKCLAEDLVSCDDHLLHALVPLQYISFFI